MNGRLFHVLLALTAAGLVVSGIGPTERGTWAMEIAPVVLAWTLLIATRRRFPLTPLVLVLIFLHGIILMIGAHWTYAEVPAGFWVRDALGLARNHYDRLGHFAQGFVPVVAAREVLVRCSPLRRGGWLAFLSAATVLAFSAFYEMIEWWAALLTSDGAVAFLGTQGDPWDTQWDMFLCLAGSVAALALLTRWHDKQLAARGLAPLS